MVFFGISLVSGHGFSHANQVIIMIAAASAAPKPAKVAPQKVSRKVVPRLEYTKMYREHENSKTQLRSGSCLLVGFYPGFARGQRRAWRASVRRRHQSREDFRS